MLRSSMRCFVKCLDSVFRLIAYDLTMRHWPAIWPPAPLRARWISSAPLCRLRASDFPCLLSRQNQIQPPSLQQQHHFRAASQGASLTSRLLCSSDSFIPAIARISFAVASIVRISCAVASIDFPLHVSGRRILYEAFSAEFRSR